MKHQRRIAYFALLAMALVWGIAPPVIKYTLQYADPVNFLFYRFLLASIIVIGPLVVQLYRNRPTLRELFTLIFVGFIGTPLSLYLLFLGIDRTTSVESSIIWVLSPILILLGGWSLLKEKIDLNEKIGAVLAILGILLTVIQPLFENGINPENLKGNLLVLGGTICWAVYSLLVKKDNNKKLSPFILTASSFVIAAICFFPFAATSNFALDLRALPGIIYMAIFGSIVAYLAYTYAISKIEVSEASMFTYLEPLFGVPAAMVFLGEKITFPFIIGAVLITTGIIISQRKTKQN